MAGKKSGWSLVFSALPVEAHVTLMESHPAVVTLFVPFDHQFQGSIGSFSQRITVRLECLRFNSASTDKGQEDKEDKLNKLDI